MSLSVRPSVGGGAVLSVSVVTLPRDESTCLCLGSQTFPREAHAGPAPCLWVRLLPPAHAPTLLSLPAMPQSPRVQTRDRDMPACPPGCFRPLRLHMLGYTTLLSPPHPSSEDSPLPWSQPCLKASWWFFTPPFIARSYQHQPRVHLPILCFLLLPKL